MIKDPPQEWLTTEEEKDFRIRFDIIVKNDLWSTSNWKEHPVTLLMASMLETKDIEILFQEVIENEPLVESNMGELRDWMLLSKSDDIKTKDTNRKLIRDFLNKNRGAGAGIRPFNLYYIFESRYFGMNLNQQIEVSKGDKNFPFFFSFRLSKTNYPVDFLEYHLEETFNNDSKKYKHFLVLALEKHPQYLSQLERTIDLWIDDELKSPSSSKITPIIAAYMVKFISEATGEEHNKLFIKMASEYSGHFTEGSLKTRFYAINKGQNIVFHKSHRKEIESAIEILKVKEPKAHNKATTFLKELG